MTVSRFFTRLWLALACVGSCTAANLKGRAVYGDASSQRGIIASDSVGVHLGRAVRDTAMLALHQPLERVRVQNMRLLRDAAVSVYVSTDVLEYSGQWFEVSWQGVPTPSVKDWVGIWTADAADDGFATTAPLKWKLAVEDSQYLAKGGGTLKFRLLNHRQDLVFAFARNGFENPVVVAVSKPIFVAQPNESLHGHLALTGQTGEMQVQWTTRDSGKPLVKWGTQPGRYLHKAEAKSFTYRREDMCGPPATTVGFIDPGMQHVAVMTGLKPSMRYFYVYGDEAWGFSAEASFVSAPETSPDTTVKFLAVADMGQAEVDGSLGSSSMVPSLNTTRLMKAELPEHTLLLHNGDISYARGYTGQWDNFFDQLQPVASSMPYMVSIGNHERNWPGSGDLWGGVYGQMDSGGECGVPHELRIRMPYTGRDKLWYSFDYGPVHFLQYSTEHEVAPGTEQYDFILKDLQAVDRSRTPWVIVGGHRPMYVSSPFSEGPASDLQVSKYLQDSLEDIFLQYKVDVTLHGHHHSYQRTCPLARGVCQGYGPDGSANAPVHLVIGNAGAMLTQGFAQPPPDWLEKLIAWWGYLRVEASGSHLRMEMVSTEDGKVVDTLTLRKPHASSVAHTRGWLKTADS